MALDKVVDSTQLDSDLTSVANAIRTKGGTSASMAFPSGFVSAIDAISTGGNTPITGSFTPSSTGTYVLSFGKTISNYIALIEMDETSKTSLISEGLNSGRAYFFLMIYDKPKINNKSANIKTALIEYYNASSDSVTITSAQITGVSSTYMEILVYDVSYGYAYGLINGYKYNYTIIPLS